MTSQDIYVDLEYFVTHKAGYRYRIWEIDEGMIAIQPQFLNNDNAWENEGEQIEITIEASKEVANCILTLAKCGNRI